MLKHLLMVIIAFVLLLGAAVGSATPITALHCNQKVCVAGEEGDECKTTIGGPETHCIATTSGESCGWDMCEPDLTY